MGRHKTRPHIEDKILSSEDLRRARQFYGLCLDCGGPGIQVFKIVEDDWRRELIRTEYEHTKDCPRVT